MQTSFFEDPDWWASSLLNFIPIKQAYYLNMSFAIFAIVCMDNVTFPKEPPVLLKAGAEAWPSTSDTGWASDNTDALLLLLRCQDH